MNRCAYIFLDEAGNFNFSTNGTRYFVLTSVSTRRPFALHGPLDDYKHECLEVDVNLDTEYFHCAEDNRKVSHRVFELIAAHLNDLSIDSLIVEKRKTDLALREDRRFYPEMLAHLLKHVLPMELNGNTEEVIVITDTIPVQKKRRAIEKAIRKTLVEMLPAEMRYRVLHHQSRSHYGLQVADYCCWAVFRKCQKGETEYYDQISAALRSEIDIFRSQPAMESEAKAGSPR